MQDQDKTEGAEGYGGGDKAHPSTLQEWGEKARRDRIADTVGWSKDSKKALFLCGAGLAFVSFVVNIPPETGAKVVGVALPMTLLVVWLTQRKIQEPC